MIKSSDMSSKLVGILIKYTYHWHSGHSSDAIISYQILSLVTTVLFFHFGRAWGGDGGAAAQTVCSSENDDAKNLFFFHGVGIVQLAGHPTEKPDAILTG